MNWKNDHICCQKWWYCLICSIKCQICINVCVSNLWRNLNWNLRICWNVWERYVKNVSDFIWSNTIIRLSYRVNGNWHWHVNWRWKRHWLSLVWICSEKDKNCDSLCWSKSRVPQESKSRLNIRVSIYSDSKSDNTNFISTTWCDCARVDSRTVKICRHV